MNIKGQRFGDLTAVRDSGRRTSYRSPIWLFRCKCGNEEERSALSIQASMKKHVTRGTKISCLECHKKRGWRHEPGVANYNHIKLMYKKHAKERGFQWRLDDIHFDRLVQENCHYCGAPPSNISRIKDLNGEFIYQGIDRIDSSMDYVPFNCVSCCAICNYAKLDTPYLDFIAWIKRVSKHLEV